MEEYRKNQRLLQEQLVALQRSLQPMMRFAVPSPLVRAIQSFQVSAPNFVTTVEIEGAQTTSLQSHLPLKLKAMLLFLVLISWMLKVWIQKHLLVAFVFELSRFSFQTALRTSFQLRKSLTVPTYKFHCFLILWMVVLIKILEQFQNQRTWKAWGLTRSQRLIIL